MRKDSAGEEVGGMVRDCYTKDAFASPAPAGDALP